jgi:hypothetical protein
MNVGRCIAAVSVAVLTALIPVRPSSAATPPAKPQPPQRIELPGAPGKPFPYTVEIPANWKMRQVEGIPGVWLGPTDAQPPNDPRLVYVRISPTPLTDPAKTVANIRAADATQPWSVPFIEAREVNGIPAVLLRMDSGEGAAARSTLVLKLPLEGGGLDFLGAAPRAEFAKLLPVYQKVFFSVRRVAAGG